MVSSSVLDVKQDGSVPGTTSKLYMSPRAGESAWLTYHLINSFANPLIVNVNEIIIISNAWRDQTAGWAMIRILRASYLNCSVSHQYQQYFPSPSR
jgi:hypothetical protein